MPKTREILSGLQSIADNYKTFAIIWHVLMYVLFAALLMRWQPSARTLGLALSLPLASVALLAWLTGNPFNGLIFSLIAALSVVFSLKAPGGPLQTSQVIFIIIGIVMVVFGMLYPHFIKPDSVFAYALSSPFGLIPCPTLSVIIGILLIYNGFGSQALTLVFVGAGLFYGLFGTLKLGVSLDIFLVAGTLSLLVKYLISLRA